MNLDLASLTVVGVLNSQQPKKGKGIIEVSAKKEYLDGFNGKEIYFAESKLSVTEFMSFFEKHDLGGQKLGVYMKTQNSDMIFKNKLFDGSDFLLKEVRYDANYKRILNLENMIIENNFTQDRVNNLRAQVLYAQTFEQAKYLLHEGSLNIPANKVLYVNYVAGYSIHLMTGCKFLEDVPLGFDTQKLKDDLALIYKAYKLNSVWEFDQKPNLTGSWGKGNDFKLFYFFSDDKSKAIEGFISDGTGLQYFTGSFTSDGEGMEIKSKYFTNHGMLPSRWHLIHCFSEKEMHFCFKTKIGFFKTKTGRKKNFSFQRKNP